MIQYKACSSDDDLPFLAGGCAMGALMRAHDWSRSPLGEPDQWPTSLRTVVALSLHASTPMFLVWGKELALLYNDAYLEILGSRHPAALGRPLAEV